MSNGSASNYFGLGTIMINHSTLSRDRYPEIVYG